MPNQTTVALFAPAVPERARRLIEGLSAQELSQADSKAYRTRRRRLRAAAIAAGSLATLGVGWVLLGPGGLLSRLGVLAGLSVMGSVLYQAVMLALQDSMKNHDTDYRALDAARKWRGQYLTAEEFAPDAAALLTRLQAAAERIAAAVAAAEELGGIATPAALAEQTWQTGNDLAAYSRLMRDLPAGEETAAERAMVDERFSTLRDLVEAQERLADATAVADRRVQDRRRLEPVLDLAAGSARDELAIEEANRQRQILDQIIPGPAVSNLRPDDGERDQSTATQIPASSQSESYDEPTGADGRATNL